MNPTHTSQFPLRPNELARACGAEIVGGALPESIRAVGTDSRSLPPDSLFVALRGERFDGHAFVLDVLRSGAAGAVVDTQGAKAITGLPAGKTLWVVKDTLQALGDMARATRRSRGLPIVGVTGSNGKTTTKELIAAALSAKGAVHKTKGNLNNLIGVPQTLFAWPEGTWAAVVEMGMNQFGEIARLTEIAEPNVGLITCVAAAHLERVGSLEGVARAKGELFAGLHKDATAIINTDDPKIVSISKPLLHGQKTISFGKSQSADVRLTKVESTPEGSLLEMSVMGRPQAVTLPLHGEHNAMNAAAAMACAIALGMDSATAARGIASVAVPGGRMRVVVEPKRQLHVIDDTYNANPGSMRAAMQTFAQMAPRGRRFVVLGDMFELGNTAPALHAEVGAFAGTSGIDRVWALGNLAEHTAAGAKSAGVEAVASQDIKALLSSLDATLSANDWVLVKGSRGMQMERVVRHLLGES